MTLLHASPGNGCLASGLYYYNSTTKVKNPNVRNSRKFEHAEITRSTGVSVPELRGQSFCDHSWFVAVHYVD